MILSEQKAYSQLRYRGQLSHRTYTICLLYTSDAADDLLCVDLGGRRIIKKKTKTAQTPTVKPNGLFDR